MPTRQLDRDKQVHIELGLFEEGTVTAEVLSSRRATIQANN
jgi:hypothetical protein